MQHVTLSGGVKMPMLGYGIQLEAWATFGKDRGGFFELPELKAIDKKSSPVYLKNEYTRLDLSTTYLTASKLNRVKQ